MLATKIAAEFFSFSLLLKKGHFGMDKNVNVLRIVTYFCNLKSLIKIYFLPAGKQCSGMRWRETDAGDERKEERGGREVEVETKERRRTPRIGEIPR